ncbi:MAG: lactate utilization protein C [Candidatus Dormibacteria bacterium]
MRQALEVAVPPSRHAPAPLPDGPPPVAWAPGPSGIDAFTEALTALGGSVTIAGAAGAAATVRRLVAGRAPVLLGAEPIIGELELGAELDTMNWPHCGLAAAATAAVAVVGCRAAIARTGSVVVDARLGRGRAASLLPPACIYVFRAEQVVETPGDVLRHREQYWPEGPPSQVVLVTGPSRSADIEMTLTRGVHGPGEIHAVIVTG